MTLKKTSKCATCVINQPHNPKEPLIPNEVPNRPWSKIGVIYLNTRDIIINIGGLFLQVAKSKHVG